MLVRLYGSAVYGVNAAIVKIEVHSAVGKVKTLLSGLPDNAIKESLQRVEAAIKVNGFRWPGRRIVINLAPADIRKEGSAYDLTIALGILVSSGQLELRNIDSFIIMGELALDGSLQPVKGALPIAICARDNGFSGLILPKANALEAAVVEGVSIYGLNTLKEVIGFLQEKIQPQPTVVDIRNCFDQHDHSQDPDFSEVKGQENIKRALEIAAAGGHNAILIGPPGAGKTMLARRLPGILPPLTIEEALETTKIHSVAGKLGTGHGLITIRPFRSPHHTISDVALVGGGGHPQPGEISLAHNGVLFLDELPEFKRQVLEVMRQPLEDRHVTISRASFTVDYPASFMLIASMNPCPCGYYNHPERECLCNPGMVQKYLTRISGPLLDRIDLHVEVVPVPFSELSSQRPVEKSTAIRQRVIKARELQTARFQKHPGIYCNSMMTTRILRKYCILDDACNQLLKTAMENIGMSARAFDRIIKVSRTIADLDNAKNIEASHLAEAIQYRSLDRDGWGG
jgi:magnesium chelatase family protein